MKLFCVWIAVEILRFLGDCNEKLISAVGLCSDSVRFVQQVYAQMENKIVNRKQPSILLLDSC
jgi:hypothetical protein